MIYGFFEPVEPRIHSFYYTEILQNYKKHYGGIFEHIVFANQRIKNLENVGNWVHLTF